MTNDYEGLNRVLIRQGRELLTEWFPHGTIRGNTFYIGDITGAPGNSLTINILTGQWKDHADPTHYGGDYIQLFASRQDIKNGEAGALLSFRYNFPWNGNGNGHDYFQPVVLNQTKPEISSSSVPKPELPVVLPPTIIPPRNTEIPSGVSGARYLQLGNTAPVQSWVYHTADDKPWFFVCRYEPAGGKKFYTPWTWDGVHWRTGNLPNPRPIYNLQLLSQFPEKQILIVEGEKTCDAAEENYAGDIYIPMTWCGGALAISKTDWTPITGRQVLIWPDADDPGREAGLWLYNKLTANGCAVKLINPRDKPDGWDAADAAAEGITGNEFIAWARENLHTFVDTKTADPASQPLVIEHADAVQINQQTTINQKTTINLESSPSEPEPSISQSALWARLGIEIGQGNKPVTNLDSLVRIFQGIRDIQGSVWFDTFHNNYFTTHTWDGSGQCKPRQWVGEDDRELCLYFQDSLGMRGVTTFLANEAMQTYACRDKRNAPRDWLSGLVWDRVTRIDRFLVTHFGASDNFYTLCASKNFWIAMCARIFNPGCQVDNMLVLESPEGEYKTSALGLIGGDWFFSTHADITGKDFYIDLQGMLLIEIAELQSFKRAELTAIRNAISRRNDRFRAPYARVAENHPRACVFVGSTNETHYLQDVTGARRFWPIRTRAIDRDAISRDREQLFAEALHRFKANESWWEMPGNKTKAEQEARREQDEWENIIIEFLRTNWLGESISIQEICEKSVLKIEPGKIDRHIQMRIGKVLRLCGYENRVVRIANTGKQIEKRWFPTAE